MPSPAEVQARWCERIRGANIRRVDSLGSVLDKPLDELSMLERDELHEIAAVLQACARRPDIVAAAANVAQVYSLNGEVPRG